MRGKKIVVWFSSGAASAIAAKKTIELYGKDNEIIVVNNPVIEEDCDNVRFLKDIEAWLGVTIQYAINSRYNSCSAVDVWDRNKYMSGVAGAPCTKFLKKYARYEWEKNNQVDYHVLGFTADEKKRHDRFILTERDNVLPVLIDLNITKEKCFEILKDAGIRLPRVYSMGYPNANCIGCVKSSSPSYWSIVRDSHPQVFIERCEQSRKIGCKLLRIKGKRVFLDELPENFKKVKLRKTNFECGIFCEEKK